MNVTNQNQHVEALTKYHCEQLNALGDQLRVLRIQKGLTQKQVAMLMGYSTSQISRIENKTRKLVLDASYKRIFEILIKMPDKCVSHV